MDIKQIIREEIQKVLAESIDTQDIVEMHESYADEKMKFIHALEDANPGTTTAKLIMKQTAAWKEYDKYMQELIKIARMAR